MPSIDDGVALFMTIESLRRVLSIVYVGRRESGDMFFCLSILFICKVFCRAGESLPARA